MTMIPSTALLLLALLLQTALLQCVTAEYTAKDAVVVLTAANFDKEVLQSNDYWLVEFYAPWCGHCKQLEPEYKKAAKKLKQHARLGAVDATAHAALAQQYQIQGYPTIKEFGAKKRKPSDYRGGRTARDIVAFVKSSEAAKALGVGSSASVVTTLELATVAAFLTTANVPSALFFGASSSDNKLKKPTRKPAKPPTWLYTVAEQFGPIKSKSPNKNKQPKQKKPRVQIAFVPGSDNEIANHFGLDASQRPTIVFVTADGTKFAVASPTTTRLNEATSTQFITQSLALDAAAIAQLANVSLFPSPGVAKTKPRAQVAQLDAQSVRSCLTKRGKMCVVLARRSDATTATSDDALKALAKTYRRDPFRFFGTDSDASVFAAVTSLLHAPTSAVIVIKPGKKVKFAALAIADATARDDAIPHFLDKILAGAVPFVPSPLQDTNVDLDLAGKRAANEAEATAHGSSNDDDLHADDPNAAQHEEL